MATQTTTKQTPTTPETPEAATPETPTTHALETKRQTAISGWLEAQAQLLKAQEAERSAPKPSAARALARKQRLSAGAKKANRRAEISQLELDLRLEGLLGTEGAPYSAWTEPETARVSNSHLLPMTQAEIEGKLAKVRALLATLTDAEADVKHQAESRIKALLKSAEQRGYKLS